MTSRSYSDIRRSVHLFLPDEKGVVTVSLYDMLGGFCNRRRDTAHYEPKQCSVRQLHRVISLQGAVSLKKWSL
jgi:hypothetical protein